MSLIPTSREGKYIHITMGFPDSHPELVMVGVLTWSSWAKFGNVGDTGQLVLKAGCYRINYQEA